MLSVRIAVARIRSRGVSKKDMPPRQSRQNSTSLGRYLESRQLRLLRSAISQFQKARGAVNLSDSWIMSSSVEQ